MAINDKERRAVAVRMREILRDDPHGWLDIMVAKAVVGVMGEGEKIGETVADLIDRPTCHMEGTSRSGFRCSACGEQIPPMRIFYRDSAGDHWVPMEHTRCPMCGAKVVKCDE